MAGDDYKKNNRHSPDLDSDTHGLLAAVSTGQGAPCYRVPVKLRLGLGIAVREANDTLSKVTLFVLFRCVSCISYIPLPVAYITLQLFA